MSTTNNKMSNHLDKSVIRFFLIVILIAAGTLAFKYARYKPCKEVLFSVKSDNFREGELIKFSDKTANASSWKWDFGDNTEKTESKEALHVYKKAGEYYVSLKVNGICEKIEKVVIKKKLFVIDSSKLPIFNLPEKISIGEVLKVKDLTANASTWEWRFGETASVNSTEKYAEYEYKTPGLKTVSLIVNGDIKHITKKKINVLPVEEVKERMIEISSAPSTIGDGIKDKPLDAMNQGNAPKTVPFISENQFKNNLILVSQKKMSVNSFSEYLCGDLNKKIVVNGKGTTFLSFCELIKTKKVKIKEVKLYREKGSNCIKNITVLRSKFIF